MLIALVAVVFAVFATAVMSYLCLAVPIGPWIDGTLVLLATIIFRFTLSHTSSSSYGRAVGLSTAAGGIAGITANAVAFSFPALYFLDKPLFMSWIAAPWYFMAMLMGLVLSAGGCAFIMVQFLEDALLADPKMIFPIGALIHKTIVAQNQIKRAFELIIGGIATLCYHLAQAFTRLIPPMATLTSSRSLGFWVIPNISVNLDVLPMLIAIGFVTGHVIALPLAIGSVLKIALLDVLQREWFVAISRENALFGFASGMMLYGVLISFLGLPSWLKLQGQRLRSHRSLFFPAALSLLQRLPWATLPVAIISILFFTLIRLSLLGQLFLIVGSFLCMQQVLIIAGKQGMAPLGRFATFVIIPGLILFGYDAVQVTMVSAFVEIVVGVGADLMFGRKMAQLLELDRRDIYFYQWLGLIVTACSLGAIVWLIVHTGELGTGTALCAQKAAARAVLVQAYHFDYTAIAIGFILAWFLAIIGINSTLVLSGIFMPLDFSLPLIIGGLISCYVPDRERWVPFWSGVFAISSLWMVVRLLL